MDFISKELSDFAERFTKPESALLKRINRETHAQVRQPRMLSGHLQGRLLALLSKLVRPKRILEIGTYTGYSAICLAEGLAPGGTLTTIDVNDELEKRVRGYFEEAGMSDRIDYRIGEAAKIIPTLEGNFDLVFIDADKENYPRYYDLTFNKVNLGGVLIADNVLWSGKVLDENPDKSTKAILELNQKVQEDRRVENVLLPIRDGLLVMRKKEL